MKHFMIKASDIEGRFFLDSGRDLPIRIATSVKGETKVVHPIIDETIAALIRHRIDVLVIDPFVSSHSVNENDNVAIDIVAKEWAGVAHKAGCHVHLAHHTRKTNGFEATIEDSRGASALNNAARSRRAINSMTKTEAESIGIPEEKRRLYFRADLAGSSMIAPAAGATWYKFNSVDLGNGGVDEIGAPIPGDSVGVVEPWTYSAQGIGDQVEEEKAVRTALNNVDSPLRKDARSPDWVGYVIAEALSLSPDDKLSHRQIRDFVDRWIAERHLEEYTELDKSRRPRTFVRLSEPDFG